MRLQLRSLKPQVLRLALLAQDDSLFKLVGRGAQDTALVGMSTERDSFYAQIAMRAVFVQQAGDCRAAASQAMFESDIAVNALASAYPRTFRIASTTMGGVTA